MLSVLVVTAIYYLLALVSVLTPSGQRGNLLAFLASQFLPDDHKASPGKITLVALSLLFGIFVTLWWHRIVRACRVYLEEKAIWYVIFCYIYVTGSSLLFKILGLGIVV